MESICNSGKLCALRSEFISERRTLADGEIEVSIGVGSLAKLRKVASKGLRFGRGGICGRGGLESISPLASVGKEGTTINEFLAITKTRMTRVMSIPIRRMRINFFRLELVCIILGGGRSRCFFWGVGDDSLPYG